MTDVILSLLYRPKLLQHFLVDGKYTHTWREVNIMHVGHEDYNFIYWKCIRDDALRMMQKSIGEFGLSCLF